MRKSYWYGEKYDPLNTSRDYSLCPEYDCGLPREVFDKSRDFHWESMCPQGHIWHLNRRDIVTKGRYEDSAEAKGIIQAYVYGEIYDSSYQEKDYTLCPELGCGLPRDSEQTLELRQESVCLLGHIWHLSACSIVTKGKYFESIEYQEECERKSSSL